MRRLLPKKILSNARRPSSDELERSSNSRRSKNPLDRSSNSRRSKNSRIRAYSKYDYPPNEASTQSSSLSSRIPAEITIKMDDLNVAGDGAEAAAAACGAGVAGRSPRRNFRPRIECNEDEGNADEQQHDNTNEQSSQEHNKTSNSASAIRMPERPRSAPPSYDECVQLGLFERKERRTTTTTTTATTSDTCMTTGISSSTNDRLSYGFQDDNDEEQGGKDVRKLHQRASCRTTTIAARSVQSAPEPSTRSHEEENVLGFLLGLQPAPSQPSPTSSIKTSPSRRPGPWHRKPRPGKKCNGSSPPPKPSGNHKKKRLRRSESQVARAQISDFIDGLEPQEVDIDHVPHCIRGL